MRDIPLRHEFEYFLAHQDELADKCPGRFVVIKGDEVLGAYPSVARAVKETMKKHELGTFLVQRCEHGPECYTVSLPIHCRLQPPREARP